MATSAPDKRLSGSDKPGCQGGGILLPGTTP